MALDAFHTQIMASGTKVTDLVLKLGMKSLAGVITWGLLRPEQWTDIVRDGDEIRVGGSGIESVGLDATGPLVIFYRDGWDSRMMLLPRTCEVSDLKMEHRVIGYCSDLYNQGSKDPHM